MTELVHHEVVGAHTSYVIHSHMVCFTSAAKCVCSVSKSYPPAWKKKLLIICWILAFNSSQLNSSTAWLYVPGRARTRTASFHWARRLAAAPWRSARAGDLSRPTRRWRDATDAAEWSETQCTTWWNRSRISWWTWSEPTGTSAKEKEDKERRFNFLFHCLGFSGIRRLISSDLKSIYYVSEYLIYVWVCFVHELWLSIYTCESLLHSFNDYEIDLVHMSYDYVERDVKKIWWQFTSKRGFVRKQPAATTVEWRNCIRTTYHFEKRNWSRDIHVQILWIGIDQLLGSACKFEYSEIQKIQYRKNTHFSSRELVFRRKEITFVFVSTSAASFPGDFFPRRENKYV